MKSSARAESRLRSLAALLFATFATLALLACSDAKPSLGAILVSLVTRTGDSFVVEGTVSYADGSSSDPVGEVVCVAAPEGKLPTGTTVRTADTSLLAGTGKFPMSPEAVVTPGRFKFALTATGAAGRYDVLCGATSTTGLASSEDARIVITAP
jgi:hypothetical protein